MELAGDGENEDEQMDALELRPEAAVPAPPPPELETEGAPRQETGEAPAAAEENIPAAVSASAGAPLPESPQELPGPDSLEEIGPEREPVPAQFWRDGPRDLVTGSNGSALLRRPGAGDVELDGAEKQPSSLAEDGPVPASRAAEEGLAELYHQVSQAARPAPQAPSAPQAGQTLRLGEPDSPRQLTVDELDRAVRRDSRRYDGGLEIF